MEMRAAAAVVLLVSIARAFRGPQSPTPRPRLARRLVLGAIALEMFAVPAVIAGMATLPALLSAIGVEAACFSVWLGLGSDGPPDDDDGEESPEPPSPDPDIDWDEFDRMRRRWDRPRVPA
jgi:hypothetical protein